MNKQYDVIIIGGGAAGIATAIYTARANLKILIVEENSLGGKLINISKIDNYPGFYSIAGIDLANNFISQINQYRIPVVNAKVLSISNGNIVLSNKTKYSGKAIVIATGSKLKKLDIPKAKEFEGKGISYCATCDGFFFKNKDVVVIGNNNQALQESLYLSNLVSSITIVNNEDTLNADKSLVDRINSNSKIKIINNSIPIKLNISNNTIAGLIIKDKLNGQDKIIDCSGIFPYINYNPGTDFVDRTILDDNGFVIVKDDMSTSIKGIYAAGDCVSKQLRQIVTACADGAIAATSIIKYLKNQ